MFEGAGRETEQRGVAAVTADSPVASLVADETEAHRETEMETEMEMAGATSVDAQLEAEVFHTVQKPAQVGVPWQCDWSLAVLLGSWPVWALQGGRECPDNCPPGPSRWWRAPVRTGGGGVELQVVSIRPIRPIRSRASERACLRQCSAPPGAACHAAATSTSPAEHLVALDGHRAGDGMLSLLPSLICMASRYLETLSYKIRTVYIYGVSYRERCGFGHAGRRIRRVCRLSWAR